MTSEIEGQQGMNPMADISKSNIEDYEPMRPDDPHQGERGEVVVEVDQDTDAALTEGYEAAISATTRRIKDLAQGSTPVPEGGVVTDQFMVHDDDPDPRRRRSQGGGADPHALAYLGTQYNAPGQLVAFLQEREAVVWASSTPERRLWKVRSVTFDAPMVVVRIPEQLELLTEDEAKSHDEMEERDD